MNGVLCVCCAIALMPSAFAQPKSTVETAWDLIAKGQRSQAVTLLRDVVRTDPRNADARLLLGSLLMEDGDRSESIAQISEGVRLRPRSAEAHNALGEAYNAFGDAKAARPEFERATTLDPRYAQAHVNLAAIQLQEEKLKPAEFHLGIAIRLLGKKPDAAYPRYLRAKVFANARDFTKAVVDLEQAVALRPDFAEAWSDLGEARKNLFDDEGAVAAFRKAVELSPEDAVARTRLGSKLLDAGQTREAISHLQEAVRLDPKNQSALNALQLALRRDGQAEQAEAVKKRLAELLRERDKADQSLVAGIELNNRGATLEKSGDLRGALEKYRAALELFPEHIGIRTNVAVALLKLGWWEEGLEQMREALRRDPGNAELKAALDDALGQYRAHRKTLTRP
jgi:protein O-GlcNAc transferase